MSGEGQVDNRPAVGRALLAAHNRLTSTEKHLETPQEWQRVFGCLVEIIPFLTEVK